MSLQDAVDVLDEHANGRPLTNKPKLVAGVRALEMEASTNSDRNLSDALAALQHIATGGKPSPDQAGRERAIHLASIIAGMIRKKSRPV